MILTMKTLVNNKLVFQCSKIKIDGPDSKIQKK